MYTRRSVLKLVGVGGLGLLATSTLPGCLSALAAEEQVAVDLSTTDELPSLRVFLFDTYIEIKALCGQEVLDALDERLHFFEETLSRTREGSDIFRINAAQGAAVEVNPETAAIISRALAFGEESDGLFDITIGAASSLWDFKQGVVPDPAVLAEAIGHIDYRQVEVTGSIVQLHDPAAQLDLGGIAKGAIADDAVLLLREAGVSSALINLGGNVYALGNRPDGTPWIVGVQSPFDERGTLFATLPASDLSVVTSGPYERGFEAEGRFYHHILDPQTGYPVETDLAGTTIISIDSTVGDVLSTTSFLLGHQAAFDLLTSRADTQALLIDTTGEATLVGGAEVDLL